MRREAHTKRGTFTSSDESEREGGGGGGGHFKRVPGQSAKVKERQEWEGRWTTDRNEEAREGNNVHL